MQNKEKGRAWIFLIIYSLIIILTLPLMPLLLKVYYNNSSFPLSWVCYILSALLGIYIFVYLIFIKGEQRGIVYFWFILLSFISAFLISRQKLPAEKFHFIEYGFLSYFSYSAVEKSLEIGQLLHYTFVSLIVLIISSIDEFIQYLLPNRVGEFSDIFLNLISGMLGLMTIVLVLRRHEKWNFKFRGTHESG
ncbi:MAG: VanZ family protein [Nitrospinota bacterium]